MTVSRDICRTVYDSSSVDQKLRNFRMEMKKAIESEEDEDFQGYLTNLKQMVDALLEGSWRGFLSFRFIVKNISMWQIYTFTYCQ